MTGYEIIMSLLMLCFWIGFWLWFFTRNDARTASSLQRNIAGLPTVLDSRGRFISGSLNEKTSEPVADVCVLDRIRSEGF